MMLFFLSPALSASLGLCGHSVDPSHVAVPPKSPCPNLPWLLDPYSQDFTIPDVVLGDWISFFLDPEIADPVLPSQGLPLCPCPRGCPAYHSRRLLQALSGQGAGYLVPGMDGTDPE